MEPTNASGSAKGLGTIFNLPVMDEGSSCASAAVVDSCHSVSVKSMQATVKAVNWMMENRGGLALLTGLIMVPSQVRGIDKRGSDAVIEYMQSDARAICVEKFSLPFEENAIDGVVCFPREWHPKDSSRCVLYHNPNDITLAGYFKEGNLTGTPGELLTLYNCPVILYDYRGTGGSQPRAISTANVLSSIRFRSTYESIVKDGEAVLKFALKQYKEVEIWGSSLGGGVATVSLYRHLIDFANDLQRVALYNHDSFTTTSQVIIPTLPNIADAIGGAIGGKLDAETPMKHLLEMGVRVTVLCHTEDPVIPVGARMADFMSTVVLPSYAHVSLISSHHRGHGNLSRDMMERLKEQWQLEGAK